MDESGQMAAVELQGASGNVVKLEVTLEQESGTQTDTRKCKCPWKTTQACKHLSFGKECEAQQLLNISSGSKYDELGKGKEDLLA